MDIYAAYAALDSQLLKVARSINKLQPVVNEETVLPIRLKESPFVLSEKVARTCQAVVTAHNLQEYRNRYYFIAVRENIHSPLEVLVHKSESEDWECF